MATETKKGELKHLGLVKKAAIQTFAIVTNLYEYAKQNSGPLKPAVGTVESAVTTVVGPVYDKFKDVPEGLLGFLDKKVDEAAQKFDEVAPASAKKYVNQANGLIQKGVEKAQKLMDEVKVGGPWAGIQYAATESRNLLVVGTVKGWVLLDQNPTVHKLAGSVLPTANRWSAEYNYAIKELVDKGYSIFNYLPSVPLGEIKKTYENYEAAGKKGDVPAPET